MLHSVKPLLTKLYQNKGTSEAGCSPMCAHFLVKPVALGFTYDIRSLGRTTCFFRRGISKTKELLVVLISYGSMSRCFYFLFFGWWANKMFGSIGWPSLDLCLGNIQRSFWHLKDERREPKLLGGNMVNQILTIVPFVTLLVPTIGKPSMNEWVGGGAPSWFHDVLTYGEKVYWILNNFSLKIHLNSKLKNYKEKFWGCPWVLLECPQWVEFIEGDLDIFRPQMHRRYWI